MSRNLLENLITNIKKKFSNFSLIYLRIILLRLPNKIFYEPKFKVKFVYLSPLDLRYIYVRILFNHFIIAFIADWQNSRHLVPPYLKSCDKLYNDHVKCIFHFFIGPVSVNELSFCSSTLISTVSVNFRNGFKWANYV